MISRLKLLVMGRKKLQWLFERLYRISLRGMHYGNGAFVTHSGEVSLIKELFELTGRKPQILVFDVGSNAGEYAWKFIENYRGNFRMHCFEPSRFTFERLSKKICNQPNIILNNIGFGSEASEGLLYFEKEGSTNASLYPLNPPGLDVGFTRSESVVITTLDEYCKTNQIDQIDFLKIDVEGHEVGVLEGARNLLKAGKIQAIQFEIGPGSLFSQAYLKRFFELLPDFTIFRVLRDGIHEIVYEEVYEIFLTTNYFALRNEAELKAVQNRLSS